MTLELIERLTSEAGKWGLEFLLIGGHAVIRHGYQRLTVDVDFLCLIKQRGDWNDLMSKGTSRDESRE